MGTAVFSWLLLLQIAKNEKRKGWGQGVVAPGGTPLPPMGMDPVIPGFYYPLLPPADPAHQLQNRGQLQNGKLAHASSPCHLIS